MFVNRVGAFVVYGLWLMIMALELLGFYRLTHEVHTADEMIFFLALIFVTLVAGAVGIFLYTVGSRDSKEATNEM